MAAKKKAKVQKLSLLEAWMGYIYEGNDCPAGLAALKFLRECISKGIIKNADVWKVASSEMKASLLKQFGVGNTYANAAITELRDALSHAKRAKLSTKNIEATLKAAEEEIAKAYEGTPPSLYERNGKVKLKFVTK